MEQRGGSEILNERRQHYDLQVFLASVSTVIAFWLESLENIFEIDTVLEMNSSSTPLLARP